MGHGCGDEQLGDVDDPGADGILSGQSQVCAGTWQTGLGSCYIFRRHEAFNSQTACA